MKPSRQQFEQAALAGEAARRVGKRRDQSPMYAMGEAGQILRERWQEGWDRADRQTKGEPE